MDLIPTTITIHGTAYDEAARAAADLSIQDWGWDLDADGSVQFSENTPTGVPSWLGGQLVSLAVTPPGGSPTAVFSGEIANVQPSFGGDGWTVGYRALGLKYRANTRVSVRAQDGTGTINFNLPLNYDAYLPAFAGQSVGQILTYLFTRHAAALAAVGVSTDATTAAQLAALTLVPNDSVVCSGRFFVAVDTVLREWARNCVCFVTADGLVRILDTTALTDVTVTEGSPSGYAVDNFRFSSDVTDQAARVQITGGPKVAAFFGKQTQNLITPAWTSSEQADYVYTDFTQPGDAFDTGAVVSITSPTTVVIQSSDASRTEPVNFWPGVSAWLHVFNPGATGLAFSESIPVTASDAMTAGGTATITLAYGLDNSSTHAYSTYQLVGAAPPLGSGGKDLNNVWRLYNVTDPGLWVATHLEKSFPAPTGFIGYAGDSEVLTTVPSALVVTNSGATVPFAFDLLPQTGQIRFKRPVIEATTNMATLQAGGAPIPPADVYVMLAYSRGPLTATYPADVGGVPQYSGPVYDATGLDRTAYYDRSDWVYAGNQPLFDALAKLLHDSLCDGGYSGNLQTLGAYTPGFQPGIRLSLAAAGYATGQEAIKIPVRSFRMRYHPQAESGVLYSCELGCSSKRNPTTGERYYAHPATLADLTPNYDRPTFAFPGAGGGQTQPQAQAGESQEGGGS